MKGLQDLSHVDHMLFVVSAADDDVVHPGKGSLAVSNSSVHVPLEGGALVPQTSNRLKGVVMAVFCTS